jgi:ligand-binding sensor domain-containing protein
MEKFRNFILWVSLAFCLNIAAQEPAYLHYDVSDGLPSSLVYCVLQDSKGLMWFGTDKGLARFDGSRFKVYGIKDGLPDLEVLGLFEDDYGRIWMSCIQNKPAYLLDGQVFTAENDSMLAKISMVSGTYTFFKDKDKSVWIAGDPYQYCRIADQEVFCFETPKKMKDGSPFSKGYGPSIRYFNRIGDHIFAFGNESILVFDKDGKVEAFIIMKDFIDGKLEYNDVLVAGNKILYSFQDRIVLLEIEEKQVKKVVERKGNHFNSLKNGNWGEMWVCSQSDGVLSFSENLTDLNDYTHLITGKRVTDLLIDREDSYWFCTYNDGVYILPKNVSVTYNNANYPQLKSNNIVSLAKTKNGTVLAGDDGGYLYEIKGQKWETHKVGPPAGLNRVLQIMPYSEEDWIAVCDRGIFFRNGERLRIFDSQGAPKSFSTKNDEMWLGTSNFLAYKPPGTDTIQRIGLRRTTTLCLDQEGILWAGGYGGLMSSLTGFQEPIDKSSKVLTGRINDIEPANANKIYIATPSYGLIKLYTEKGKILKMEIANDSLKIPIENVVSVLYDKENDKVWLATNSGVYSINKNHETKKYDTRNGLASNNINAILVTSDTLYVGTTAGLSVLPLNNREKSNNEFMSLFSEVRYFQDQKLVSIDLLTGTSTDNQVTLPADLTLLEVFLTGLTYNYRNNLSFEYSVQHQLLPIWQMTWENLFNSLASLFKGEYETTTINDYKYAYGANTSPGKFKLSVTAILPTGERSSMPDHLRLVVQPHWWQIIWLHLALAAILGYVIWRLVKDRERLLKIQSVNSELQLQAIRAQMNPHFVGNSINAIQQFFYPPDPVKASEYISIFSDLLRRTMHFSETDFIPFEEELSYIKDYLEMIQLRFGGRFSYSIIGAEEIPQKILFPSMLLQPILENATIHGLAPSGSSNLDIHFSFSEGRLECSVTDNGVGILASRERKAALGGPKRISKGILLLEKKVETLNVLHRSNINLQIVDLAKSGTSLHGTQVTLSFSPASNKSNDMNKIV